MTTSPPPPTEPPPADDQEDGQGSPAGDRVPVRAPAASGRASAARGSAWRRLARRFAIAGRLAVVLTLLGAVGLSVWGLARLADPPRTDARRLPQPALTPAPVQPGAEVPAQPGGQPVPQASSGRDAVAEWADSLASTVDVPARALRAYAAADLALRAEAPRCRVSWATLAGIGRIESDHGRYGGTSLGSDGRPSDPIIGIPLNGAPGVATIVDTDGGQLDGDRTHDRAVGPMQFIPGTWASWGADGDGDGKADPHDIDDASLAAGRYLCADARDLGTAPGWWAAVLSYNRSVEYGQKVFGVADDYARRA